jgi:hypothetical protein
MYELKLVHKHTAYFRLSYDLRKLKTKKNEKHYY